MNSPFPTFWLILAAAFAPLMSLSKVTYTDPPWLNCGRDLRLTLQTEKHVYRAGEKVTLLFRITNLAGEPKILQSGMPVAQFTFKIQRDGKPIKIDENRPNGGPLVTWTCHPSKPIPAGESLMEILDMDSTWDVTKPGQYVVRVRKWYLPNETHRTRAQAIGGIDYLDAQIEFTVLPRKPL